MKKLFLLLAVGSVAMNVGAQELQTNNAPMPVAIKGSRVYDAASLRDHINIISHSAKKTTAGGSRGYDYCDAIDTSATFYNGASGYTALHNLYEETIWNDTNGTAVYTGPTYKSINTVSEAVIFDPAAAIFNTDPDKAYLGDIQVTAATPYNVDSVTIYGVYLYNVTKTTVVDTIRLVFVTGKGGSAATDNITASGFGAPGAPHYGVVNFLNLQYDSVKNVATGPITGQLYPSTATYPHYDIILKNSGSSPAWGDTAANGIWQMTIPYSVLNFNVPAGAFAGMSITFISGDPATKTGLLSHAMGDTLVSSFQPGSGMNKYNVWRPLVSYYANGDGKTPAYAPFQSPAYEPFDKDQNLGYWKTLPNFANGWENLYYPGAWGYEVVGGGAFYLQYPLIDWFITCPTCVPTTVGYLGTNIGVATVNSIKAIPNPANESLNISFDLTEKADVSLTLTNMLGQTVASQKVANTTGSNVVFNTATLPAGMYIYTLQANGYTTTGRVAIAH